MCLNEILIYLNFDEDMKCDPLINSFDFFFMIDKKGLIALPSIRDSIVVSISACHAEDPGSIPGRGVCCACEGRWCC